MFGTRLFRRHIARVGITAVALATLGITGSATAQDAATPVASPGTGALMVSILDVSGQQVGTATFTSIDGGVMVDVTVDGLPPGEHGIHIHENGICDPNGTEPFESAGGHFNPDSSDHGAPLLATPGATPIKGEEHAGDLANITVDESGHGEKAFQTDLFTLSGSDMNSLNDIDGSAIVIHADPDDLVTDPSGNSGDRIACGVIFSPTRMVEPEASPVS